MVEGLKLGDVGSIVGRFVGNIVGEVGY